MVLSVVCTAPNETLAQNPKNVEFIAQEGARKAKEAFKLNRLAKKSRTEEQEGEQEQEDKEEERKDKDKECENTISKPYLGEITAN
jgi:hypothetical protein